MTQQSEVRYAQSELYLQEVLEENLPCCILNSCAHLDLTVAVGWQDACCCCA